MLGKQGIDPVKDVDWRQYPLDLLALAVEKGEVQALADNDPRTYLWLKDGKLNEILTNLSGEFADRICCLLAVRGSPLRNERVVAGALTRAVLEAGDMVGSLSCRRRRRVLELWRQRIHGQISPPCSQAIRITIIRSAQRSSSKSRSTRTSSNK